MIGRAGEPDLRLAFTVAVAVGLTHAIASGLSMAAAPVLVLDDALASVDNNTAAAILDSIRAQDDRTIVMISHQLSAAAACDRILVMENGRIVQQGHHNALIQQPGVYKRLWERQQASQQLDALAS